MTTSNTTDEPAELYQQHDYFAMRAVLDGVPQPGSPAEELYRAMVQAAFNDPAPSNATLDRLEACGAELPDSLQPKLYQLRYRNDLRLYQYQDALASARALLSLQSADSALKADVRNTARLLDALQDVSPQRVVRRGESRIRRLPNTRVPVQIGDLTRTYVFDTGANFSIMMRSEAQALGLTVRDAGIKMGTVTDTSVTAGIAVADRFRIGEVQLRNVVFLVLPDEALTYEGGFRIPGLIGFPVADALGEVRFQGDSVIRIPANPPRRTMHNLALDGLDPLTQVQVFGDTVVCELDTGSELTDFYAPFYERHREAVEAAGRDTLLTATGIGGSQQIRAYVLPSVQLHLGGRSITLRSVDVDTKPIGSGSHACRIGRNALQSTGEYIINFQSMAFLLQ